MFLGYTVYRISYPQAFAEASRHTLIVFGCNEHRGAFDQQHSNGLRGPRRAGEPARIARVCFSSLPRR